MLVAIVTAPFDRHFNNFRFLSDSWRLRQHAEYSLYQAVGISIQRFQRRLSQLGLLPLA